MGFLIKYTQRKPKFNKEGFFPVKLQITWSLLIFETPLVGSVMHILQIHLKIKSCLINYHRTMETFVAVASFR
jgi:hypothetical protein